MDRNRDQYMDQKQFREALLRGQGRCVLAVQKAPARYARQVLWACGHPIAFDPQCEGSHAFYTYDMVCCYEDRRPFLDTACAALARARSDGWDGILYFSELLALFARDGEPAAEAALWRKYEAMYAALAARKRRPSGRPFPLLDDFEALCLAMLDLPDAAGRIAAGLGRLYQQNSLYNGGDLDWLYTCMLEKQGRFLRGLAKRDEDAAAFLAEKERWEKEWRARSAARQTARAAQPKPPRQDPARSIWLRRNADDEMIRQYADAYRNETDPARRAEALGAFCRCPYPGDPAPLLRDAASAHPALSCAAWDALRRVRHPQARQLALDWLARRPADALPVLAHNFTPQDGPLLEKAVRALPGDDDDRHALFSCLIDHEEEGARLPAGLLYYLYEIGRCSVCRAELVRLLARRRLLTEALLRECLWDANDGLRADAARRLRQRLHRRLRRRGATV